ncbi:MAG: TIGR04076 family protein [Bacillota bacterium]
MVGYKITGRITEVKGECSWGHKAGDCFALSCYDTANLCGFFYHDIFPVIKLLQFGGSYPWGDDKDRVEVECCDRLNAVKMELVRLREDG